MKIRFLMTTAASVFALSVAGGATAQQAQGQSDVMDPQLREKIELGTWDYQALYESGWRADDLIGSTVIGSGGEDIGEVSNIIVGPDDSAQAIIVEAGGFLDLGSVYLRVPWDQVQWTPGAGQVQAPIREDNVADFSLFGGEQPTAEGQAWRVTTLLGDYVSLQDRPGYGMVDDVVFSQDGAIQAVVVQPDVAAGQQEGPVALPYSREDMGREATPAEQEGRDMNVGMASAQSGEEWYGAPYTYREVQELDAFEAERMER
jgi:sporulation protein YlmC with PRC-barrel domain